MKKRFCYGCAGDVEIVDGFCLLGHKADEALEPGSSDRPAPVSEIEAEVEKVLQGTDLQIQRPSEPPGTMGAGLEAVVSTVASSDSRPRTRVGRPVGEASSSLHRMAPPPPPPPALTRSDMYRDALRHLSDEKPTSDPITAFAPPPRVDWGPNKMSLFNLRGLLKQRA